MYTVKRNLLNILSTVQKHTIIAAFLLFFSLPSMHTSISFCTQPQTPVGQLIPLHHIIKAGDTGKPIFYFILPIHLPGC